MLKRLTQRYDYWLHGLTKTRSRQGLYEFLDLYYALIAPNNLVLTVGSGGDVNVLLARYAAAKPFKVVSLDIDPARGPDVLADLCRLPILDESIDTIVLAEVLEHVAEPWRAVCECQRALRPGGTLILTTPFALPMHDRPHDFFRFTSHGLALLLRGFDDVQIRARTSYFETIDVLWMRLFQENTLAARRLARLIVPAIFYLKRPLTRLFTWVAPVDGVTTGYVVCATKSRHSRALHGSHA
jgi:SAM-dependent methyltransferase